MKLDVWFIVPASDGSAILETAGATLPDAPVDGDENEASVIAISAFLRETWGFTAPVLETHPKWKGLPEGAPVPCLVMTEPGRSGWTPPAGLTFAAGPPDTAGLPESIRPRADELLAEVRAGSPPPSLRPRWSRRGWFDRASAWMRAAAADAGRPLTADPMPFFLRGISALLRAPTDGPDLFLKAVFPPFHAEPVLTRLLADRFPDAVPPLLAIEPEEGWLLVEDIGSAWVGDIPEADRPAALGRGAAALVAIQRAVARDEAARRVLLAAGAPHRPLSGLVASVAMAIGPLGMGVGDPLEPARAARVVAGVEAAVAAVERVGLPESVVHGDFHSGNAAIVDDRIVIIDWSDAAISNPAIDVITWIAWSGSRQDEIDAAIDGWIDAWSGTVDAAELRAVIDDVRIVGAAYQIVSYDGIRRNLEPATRYTMTGGGEHFLKRLEDVLDERAGLVQTS
ncbi:MAG TPA: phosphotransferase [Candidatus Limnocylindrales bacterium]|nr:phosphotransferase [Candidatus Limnocylindrales bacterium]